jgi:hypothetical protein
MTDGEKEIAELMTKWKDEIKALVTDYNNAIEKLKEIQDSFNNSFFEKNKIWIKPLISIIAVICIFCSIVFFTNKLQWETIEFLGIKITRNLNCESISAVN